MNFYFVLILIFLLFEYIGRLSRKTVSRIFDFSVNQYTNLNRNLLFSSVHSETDNPNQEHRPTKSFSKKIILVISPLTERNRKIILHCHNHYRSLLAKGKAKNKEGDYMPSAANMYLMKYSKSLESSAKEWAKQCTISHSHGKFGENLFMSTNRRLSDSGL
uniref:SCP domain-containing protein n=1 Tax=Meloidogyne enterolobii TaxID=390850 RepID=A0A6V7US37_MELEN|nr:unnamed protein product [Meloidogyne enterolobii]